MEKKKSKWISGAIKHPGIFKAAAKRAGKSTGEFAHEHEHDKGVLGKRARLATTLMSMKHKAPTASGMRKKMYGENKNG